MHGLGCRNDPVGSELLRLSLAADTAALTAALIFSLPSLRLFCKARMVVLVPSNTTIVVVCSTWSAADGVWSDGWKEGDVRGAGQDGRGGERSAPPSAPGLLGLAMAVTTSSGCARSKCAMYVFF